MNVKYIGMDVHKDTISIAVMNGEGKLVIHAGAPSETRPSPLLDRKPSIQRSDPVMLRPRPG